MLSGMIGASAVLDLVTLLLWSFLFKREGGEYNVDSRASASAGI